MNPTTVPYGNKTKRKTNRHRNANTVSILYEFDSTATSTTLVLFRKRSTTNEVFFFNIHPLFFSAFTMMSLIFLFFLSFICHLYPLKYSLNKKKSMEEKLFQTFDCAVTLTLCGPMSKSNQFI